MARRRQGRGITFIIDATGSRQPAWQTAAKAHDRLFRQAATHGGIQARLVHFGYDITIGPMVDDPALVKEQMDAVSCNFGGTQHVRGLDQAVEDASAGRISCVVMVGDCFEEKLEDALLLAATLRELGCPVLAVHEGDDHTAETAFRKIAETSGGAFCKLDELSTLNAIFEAVGAFAAGGAAALALEASQGNRIATGILRQLPAPRAD